MKLKILSYNPHKRYHVVQDEYDNTLNVDMLINGDFKADIDPIELIGKTYEVTYVFPTIYIAMKVNPNPLL